MKTRHIMLLIVHIGLFAMTQTVAEDKTNTDELSSAVKSLRRGTPAKEVGRGLAIIEASGYKGLPLLLSYIDNKEIVAGTAQDPRPIMDPDTGEHVGWHKSEIGDVVFNYIQILIEGRRPKIYANFYVIDRAGAKQWFAERKHKSLLELRVEAAKLALKKVKDAYNEQSSDESKSTIFVFERRISEIAEGGCPDIK